MSKVKEYMTKEVYTTNCDATVRAGAIILVADENAEGYAIVLERGKPVGIETEQDLVNKVLTVGLHPVTSKIREVMSPLRTIDPDEDLLKAVRIMREHNVRKLVVMRNEIIYGIITAKDIAQRCNNYVDRSVHDIIRWWSPF